MLKIRAIFPDNQGKGGVVAFEFDGVMAGDSGELQIPYQASDANAGVKEAAELLAAVLGSLADEAKKLSE